jgi:demethylmenaquinone methyltransferase / 2-methoxy-6-polyprenyl-1,4-benzoquinol methylase
MSEAIEPQARRVRDMFSSIAHRYDLLNHLLSCNIDKRWRSRTVARLRSVLARPDARVLDLACGTGDLLLELERGRNGRVFGSDFCHPMLTAARRKIEQQHARSVLFEADALRLPLRDGTLDLITVAFGLRNFADYRRGLAEMRRALRAGGVAAILEFSQPTSRLFGRLYDFYSLAILPRLGGAISGSRAAYQYLPDSVRQFPGPDGLAEMMLEAGFARVEFERMTGGVVALHIGSTG